MAAVNEPAFGPELTSRDIRYAVAIEGKADVTRTSNFVGEDFKLGY